jgi:hypothetical protein
MDGCMDVYIYIYIYMYSGKASTLMYVCTFFVWKSVCTHACTHLCLHAPMFVLMQLCMYARMNVFVFIYFIFIHLFMDACFCAHRNECMYSCTHMCRCECVQAAFIYAVVLYEFFSSTKSLFWPLYGKSECVFSTFLRSWICRSLQKRRMMSMYTYYIYH